MNTPQEEAPRIEFIQSAAARPEPGRGPRRALVFTLVFVLVAAAGLAWNYSRPAVYRASATVLTVKPKAVDARSEEADLEHVAIQGRALMSEPLLADVAGRLSRQDPSLEMAPDALRGLLELVPVEQTNLIELRAEGPDPALLQLAVNAWAGAYESHRQAQIAEAKAQTMTELEDRQAVLRETIGERQAALEDFRTRHDIVSLERADNQAPNRLRGLNASLNKARERLVEAEAARAAIDQALRDGKAVLPREQRAEFNARRLELQMLRDRLTALDEKYTRAYLERDPELKVLPDQIAALEREVETMRALGRREVLEEAERDVGAAAAALAELERQSAEHEEQARVFTALFAEHDAMQAEIVRLQDLHGENAERLAQIEARNLEKYPPVQVVDWATLPATPIHPAYARDAAIVLGIALGVALFFTWLAEYLAGQRRAEAQPYTGVRVYQEPARTPLEAPGQGAALPGGAEEPMLAAPPARELEHAELDALLRHADAVTAGSAALLLSGVAAEEIAAGDDVGLALDGGVLRIGGAQARELVLGQGAVRLIEASRDPAGALPGLDAAELDARIAVAAVDAGLPAPAGIDAQVLRRSYLLFLVRQGVRLAELSQRVGALPARTLAELGRYSPPGPNRPLDAIEVVHPALA